MEIRRNVVSIPHLPNSLTNLHDMFKASIVDWEAVENVSDWEFVGHGVVSHDVDSRSCSKSVKETIDEQLQKRRSLSVLKRAPRVSASR